MSLHKIDSEYIIASAIHINDGRYHSNQPVQPGFLLCSLRHHQCYDQMGVIYQNSGWDPRSDPEVGELFISEGFLTSHGRFVGRVEAADIAREVGQINCSFPEDRELTSEYIFGRE